MNKHSPKLKLVLQFILFKLCLCEATDWHCSISDVQRLLKNEIEFVQVLRALASFDCAVGVSLRKYLETNYQHSIYDTTDGIAGVSQREEYVSHPVNSLGIFKRLGYDFEHRLNTSHTETPDEGRMHFLTEIWPEEASGLVQEANRLASTFPDLDDYVSACDAFILMQEAYDMETQDLINGAVKINDATFQSQNKLSMVEAFQLSVRANEWGWLDLATKWIERSVNMCVDASQSQEELCQEAKTTFKLLIDVHDNV